MNVKWGQGVMGILKKQALKHWIERYENVRMSIKKKKKKECVGFRIR